MTFRGRINKLMRLLEKVEWHFEVLNVDHILLPVPKRPPDHEYIKHLAWADGAIDPIFVSTEANGVHIVVDGRHRLLALRGLGRRGHTFVVFHAPYREMLRIVPVLEGVKREKRTDAGLFRRIFIRELLNG